MIDEKLIFYVDDNKADIFLVKHLLEKMNKEQDSHIETIFFEYPVKALHHLQQIKDKKNGRIPDIFLLNINMPEMDGITLLKNIRQISIFNKVPIIMYTSVYLSQYPDIFTWGANAFLTKGSDEGFIKTIDYWLNWHPKYC